MSKKKIRTEYDKAFKFEAVKLSEKSNQNVEEVAKDLGIAVSNLHRWRREYRNASTQAFPGKGHQAEEVRCFGIVDTPRSIVYCS